MCQSLHYARIGVVSKIIVNLVNVSHLLSQIKEDSPHVIRKIKDTMRKTSRVPSIWISTHTELLTSRFSKAFYYFEKQKHAVVTTLKASIPFCDQWKLHSLQLGTCVP
jgi:hypothetical protein